MRPQRTLAPVRQGLAFLIGLVLVCDLAVMGVHALDDKTDLVRGPKRQGPSSRLTPGPGQAFLDGDVERLVADGAQGPPLASPFTITAVEPGRGRVTIDNALVNGRRVTISWDGGTPLPVSGAGGLDLGPAHLEVDGSGVVWSLDGRGRKFVPGDYGIGAPVAVGAVGLAASQERVDFTADDRTVLASRGDVIVRLDPMKIELEGPGRLEVTGNLQVQFPDRSTRASSVKFGEGPFRVTLGPADEKLRMDAILQGSVEVK